MTNQNDVRFRKWYEKFKTDNQVTFGLASEFKECWDEAQEDKAKYVKELEAWKCSAIWAESEWDIQAVGKILNIRLGEPIRSNIISKITQLQLENEKLRELLGDGQSQADYYHMDDGYAIRDRIDEALGEAK